jgi:excisionase family DNA binding protein
MAGRGRAPLTRRRSGRAVAENATRRPPSPKPLLYTAQDIARFCEVDLKTIHHWADAGKIAHHRTEGRHLRFRRNHVLAFLRSHGYPIPDELAIARPHVFYAVAPPDEVAGEVPTDDIVKKLTNRFFVRRFESALAAIAHLVAVEPDALVVSHDDPTWTGARGVRALKGQAATSWQVLVVISAQVDTAEGELKEAGADLVIGLPDVGRLHTEIARVLAVD